MKDRVKDGIILLGAFGAGAAASIAAMIIGMSSDAIFVVGSAVFLFAGWKVKNELDAALDRKCAKCGFANASESNFCRQCGTTLRGQLSVPVETPATQIP